MSFYGDIIDRVRRFRLGITNPNVTESLIKKRDEPKMKVHSENCLKLMIEYINFHTEPVMAGKCKPINHTHLSRALDHFTCPDPTFPSSVLRGIHYMRWEELLTQHFGWVPRCNRRTMEVVHLSDVLGMAREDALARDEGGLIAVSDISKPDKTTPAPPNVFDFMARHLDSHSVTIPDHKASLWTINRDILEESASLAGFLYLDQLDCDLSTNDYEDWADLLKMTYAAGERQPKLSTALQEAREAWLRLAEPQTNETPGEDDMRSALFAEVKVEDAGAEQLSDCVTVTSHQCDFCKKEASVNGRTGALLQRLTGDNQFFCSFCVRNDFHTKKRKDVLILTLRALIGYLYYFCYFGKTPRLFLSEVGDMVTIHVAIGRQNPLFVYDPDTFCWFVDFSKVGTTKKKVPVAEVIRTVNEMISAFNPYNHIKEFKSHKYSERFAEAIMDFYQRRYRPQAKAVCAPTLLHCASDMREQQKDHTTTTKKIDIAVFRDFLPGSFKLNPRR